MSNGPGNPFAGWSWLKIIILIIVIAGCIAIMYVALQQMGIMIPPFMITIFWIVLVVVVAIFAIKLIWSMF
jgi:hypothetical protein